MPSLAPPEYLVVGHLCLDVPPASGGGRSAAPAEGEALGGTAAYAALTARALGLGPSIVTAAAADLDLSPLAGIPIHRLASETTTRFVNDSDGDRRRQRLLGRGRQISADDVPAAWRGASIVHLAPIAGEVDAALIDLFPDNELLGLTPQGWMRRWDETGSVSPQAWSLPATARRSPDVVIVSLEDVGCDESLVEDLAAACRLLVVTEGSRGARVYWNGDVRRVPASPVEPVDPTGAGDIFAAAFLIRYQRTRDPWEAARFANGLAAASVGRRGLDGVPTADEVARAEMVWVR